MHEVTSAIDALLFQVRSISNEIHGKNSDKEEFLTKTNVLRLRFDECNKKIVALWEQESGILGQVTDHKFMAEIAHLERDKPKIRSEQMDVLMEEKKGYRNVSGDIRGLCVQRESGDSSKDSSAAQSDFESVPSMRQCFRV